MINKSPFIVNSMNHDQNCSIKIFSESFFKKVFLQLVAKFAVESQYQHKITKKCVSASGKSR